MPVSLQVKLLRVLQERVVRRVGGKVNHSVDIRIIAASRLILNNIPNIQASWLTVGRQTAQAALHSGANDMGSIMIEEHVVSSAGADNRFAAEGIQQALRAAGFTPRLRNQLYELRPWPLDDTLR